MPSLNQEIISRIPIPLPRIGEQVAIAHILGTLDDKIELNQCIAETLETMARVIFKSWFVDFRPIKARAQGEPADSICRRLGLSEDTVELFSSSLEDTESGSIPSGWVFGSVEEEFNLTMGQSPPGETYNESGQGLPFYQGRADFGFRFPKRRVYCIAPTRFAQPGDTLISVRAPVGDINMATEPCAIGRGIAAARHKSGARSYTYHFMRTLQPIFARFEGEGTVFGSITKRDFESIVCLIPPPPIIAAYEAMMAPLDDLVENNQHQSTTLAAIREATLPKLLSGGLCVSTIGGS